jgi:hypothetical protein
MVNKIFLWTSLLMAMVVNFTFVHLDNAIAQPEPGGGMWAPPRFILGLRAGYDYDAEVWSLGGQFVLPLGSRPGGLQIIPSGDLFFINGATDWQINLDAAIRLMMLYGGVGIAYLNRDFQQPDEKDKKTGTNLFIGMPLPLPLYKLRILSFVEARWTEVENERLFRLVVGLNFMLGSRR